MGKEYLGARGNCEEEMLVASDHDVMLDVEAICGVLVKSLATAVNNLFNLNDGWVAVLGFTQCKQQPRGPRVGVVLRKAGS